jgi:DNA-directed RNA polymerase I, II, and III subunit RPABC1
LQNYGKQCQKADVTHAIIIIKNIMTPMAKKAISEISGSAQLECFEEKELYINITEHNLVPQHVVLSEKEKAALIEKDKND